MTLSNFDREGARAVLMDHALGSDLDAVLDDLEGCVRPFTWRWLEELLEEHYPESIFPVLPDDAERDLGPRLLSLVRLLHRMETKQAAIESLLSKYWEDDIFGGYDGNVPGNEIRAILAGSESEDLTNK